MSVVRLKRELDRIEEAHKPLPYARRYALPALFEENKQALRMVTFLQSQRDCLDVVDTGVHATLQQFPAICLFLGGSLAKLEYLHGVSDLDFLAVDTIYQKATPWQKLRDEKAFTQALFACEGFAAFSKLLAVSINRGFRKRGDSAAHVDVGARPLIGRRTFYTHRELFHELGKEHEPSWAAWARSVLLLESAAWGRRRVVNRLRNKADEIYGLTGDLASRTFPAMTCSFVGLMSKSGLVAKLHRLRQSSRRPPLQSVPDTPPANRAPNAELIKTVFSRHFHSVVDRLFINALYWCSLSPPPPWRDLEEIRRWLRSPPLSKLVTYLPLLMKHINNARYRLWHEVKGRSVLYDETHEIAFMERLTTICKICGELDSSGPHVKPLLRRFREMLQLCINIRSGQSELDGSALQLIETVGKEFEEAIRDAIIITRLLVPPADYRQSVYQLLAIYTMDEIT